MDVSIKNNNVGTSNDTNNYHCPKKYQHRNSLQENHHDLRQGNHTHNHLIQNIIGCYADVCIDRWSRIDVTCAEYILADTYVVNAGRFWEEPVDVLLDAGGN